MYAKLLALRLMNILPTLINPDQSGFIKGRQTSDATRRLIDIIYLAQKKKVPSLLLA